MRILLLGDQDDCEVFSQNLGEEHELVISAEYHSDYEDYDVFFDLSYEQDLNNFARLIEFEKSEWWGEILKPIFVLHWMTLSLPMRPLILTL